MNLCKDELRSAFSFQDWTETLYFVLKMSLDRLFPLKIESIQSSVTTKKNIFFWLWYYRCGNLNFGGLKFINRGKIEQLREIISEFFSILFMTIFHMKEKYVWWKRKKNAFFLVLVNNQNYTNGRVLWLKWLLLVMMWYLMRIGSGIGMQIKLNNNYKLILMVTMILMKEHQHGWRILW